MPTIPIMYTWQRSSIVLMNIRNDKRYFLARLTTIDTMLGSLSRDAMRALQFQTRIMSTFWQVGFCGVPVRPTFHDNVVYMYEYLVRQMYQFLT